MVKMSPFNAGGHRFDPWLRSQDPTSLAAKTTKHETEAVRNKFSKNFKNGPHLKKKIFKKVFDEKHYAHIYVYVKSESVSCSVVSDSLRSMDCSLPGSSVHGIL